MTAAWSVYDIFAGNHGKKEMDFANDTFKAALVTSSYTFSAAHEVYSDITNELSTANGYTNGGVALTSVTWTDIGSGVWRFDCADFGWTASGGSITARRLIIYNDTVSSPVKPLLACCLLDDSPADVTAVDGAPFTIAVHANGLFRTSAS